MSIQEKRRFFRINDTISLLHRVVDEADIQSLSDGSEDLLGECSLTAALKVLNQEITAMARRLERRDQELMQYLKALDSKINLIAHSISPQMAEFSEHDKREVSLSAAGLAFNNDIAISVGSFVELRILLNSCMAVIVVFARVVDCKDVAASHTQHPYQICVEYMNIKEDDRELLIKHVTKKQMQQLRQKMVQA